MKCNSCGAESGKYPFCSTCNSMREKGEIKKCQECGKWHSPWELCHVSETSGNGEYLYELKRTLISKSEQAYYDSIKRAVPQGYNVFPQINLASIIAKTDNSKFHNELFRNVDFLITDSNYKPLIAIEINDQTHLDSDRRDRDEKVQKICEEAGLPLIKFWTSYGVNNDYISKKIEETLKSLPIKRINHSAQSPKPEIEITPPTVDLWKKASEPGRKSYSSGGSRSYRRAKSSGGCYVATCVYGSYDCPEVWILRRYRDNSLASSWYGRVFIKIYYAVSPTLVKIFGGCNWFKKLCRSMLDPMVEKLHTKGYENTPYSDK